MSFGSDSFGSKLMRGVSDIPVNSKADTLWTLQAAAWLQVDRDTPIAKYTLEYADGSKAEIPVLAFSDVGDWWSPVASQNCMIAWTGKNKMGTVSIFMSKWDNPHPEKVIKNISVTAGLGAPQYVVLGITLGTKKDLAIERKPVSKLSLDFTKNPPFELPRGSYVPVSNHFSITKAGYHFENGELALFGLPKENVLADFLKRPFEITFEITPEKLPEGYRGGIFEMTGFGVNWLKHTGFLEVAMMDEEAGKWTSMLSNGPLPVGKRIAFKIRYDGKRLFLYQDGALNAVKKVKIGPLGECQALLFGHTSGPQYNFNGTLHRLEFFELKPIEGAE